MGGLPIDVLFRLLVQSINGWSNATALSGAAGAASPEFFRLAHDLRVLQLAELLSIHLDEDKLKSGHTAAASRHMVLGIRDAGGNHALAPVVAEARHLLGLGKTRREAVVVYGRISDRPGEIAVLTRPMLSILAEIGYDAEVPEADIRDGRTLPTPPPIDGQMRPVLVIREGATTPKDAFVAVDYRGHAFWIADTDFDSKLAFSVVQIIMALASTSHASGTVITIPAG